MSEDKKDENGKSNEMSGKEVIFKLVIPIFVCVILAIMGLAYWTEYDRCTPEYCLSKVEDMVDSFEKRYSIELTTLSMYEANRYSDEFIKGEKIEPSELELSYHERLKKSTYNMNLLNCRVSKALTDDGIISMGEYSEIKDIYWGIIHDERDVKVRKAIEGSCDKLREGVDYD